MSGAVAGPSARDDAAVGLARARAAVVGRPRVLRLRLPPRRPPRPRGRRPQPPPRHREDRVHDRSVRRKKAMVFWGKKKLGVIAPRQPLIVQRPRDSRAAGRDREVRRLHAGADARVHVRGQQGLGEADARSTRRTRCSVIAMSCRRMTAAFRSRARRRAPRRRG